MKLAIWVFSAEKKFVFLNLGSLKKRVGEEAEEQRKLWNFK